MTRTFILGNQKKDLSTFFNFFKYFLNEARNGNLNSEFRGKLGIRKGGKFRI